MKDLPKVPIRGGYRAGVKPMTLRTKGFDITNAPPRPMADVVIVKLVDCMLLVDLDRYDNGLPLISLTTNKRDISTQSEMTPR